MTERSPHPLSHRSTTPAPDRGTPHLVDLGCRKWDPNSLPWAHSLPDWYEWMRQAGPLPCRPIGGGGGLAPDDREPLLFLDRGTEGLLASPETVEIFNFFWDRLIDSYRDPLYTVGGDAVED